MSDELRQSMMDLNRALKKAQGRRDYAIMKLIANALLAAAAFTLGYFVMTEAWGLQVQSWPWFWAGVGGTVAVGIMQHAINAE